MAPDASDGADFLGAKAALFQGGRIAVIRRDDIPDIPWPGRIDLPGGMREAGETPADCALREVSEEIGLVLASERIVWARCYPGESLPNWMVAAEITGSEAASLKLGCEGQACWMMDVDAYLAAEDAIPHQQARVTQCLAEARLSGRNPARR